MKNLGIKNYSWNQRTLQTPITEPQTSPEKKVGSKEEIVCIYELDREYLISRMQ